MTLTTTTSNSKWFTSECFDKRRTFYCKLNMYRRNNTEENRLNMIHARSQYVNVDSILINVKLIMFLHAFSTTD